MKELDLEGKVAIVTGAGRMRGIGRASANILARMGANIVITGTGKNPNTFPDDEKKADWKDIFSTSKEVESYGRLALPIVTDVTDDNAVKNLINITLETFGRIDVLVNNAAAPYGADRVPVIDLDKKTFENVINVKLYGTFLCSKYVSLQMIKQGNGGRIINLSSSAGKSVSANMAAYNAANFAIDGFTQALSKELASENITVNSVCPGLTETARLDPMWRDERWTKRISQLPLKRAAEEQEIAELIGFLSSNRASYITGQSININGGTVTER